MFEADYFWLIMTLFIVAGIVVQIILDRKKSGHGKNDEERKRKG